MFMKSTPYAIRQKRHFVEKIENMDTVSVRVRFWVNIRVRIRIRIWTFIFIDFIVCFMPFQRNVFLRNVVYPLFVSLDQYVRIRLVFCSVHVFNNHLKSILI